MSTAREPWDRREGETARAFAAFVAYRDTPPAARSIVRACKAAHGENVTGGRVSQWEKWSTAHEWVTRAEEWDDERDRIKRAAEIAAIEEMQAEHNAAARAMLAVARMSIDRHREAMEQNDELRIPAQHLAGFLRAAIDLERVSRGVPDRITQEIGEGTKSTFVIEWPEPFADPDEGTPAPFDLADGEHAEDQETDEETP